MRQLLPPDRDNKNHPMPDRELAQLYAYPGDRAWLRANMVSSIDGAASAQGRTAGLSGEADRRLFALLRALADVILVGAGTARIEKYGPAEPHPDYADVRVSQGLPPVPIMALVSARLDLDPDLPLFREAPDRTIVLTAAGAPEHRIAALGEVADVLVLGEERVDLRRATDALVNRGLSRILCEGGPALLAQLVAAGLLDELCFTISPLLCSGPAPRITTGELIEPPVGLRLDSLLEEDGTLFVRYLRGHEDVPGAQS